MPVRWQGFAVPKRGNSAEEYEDAFAGAPQAGRFAVADGASESSFASLWARLLVEGFAHPSPGPRLRKDWLEPLRQRWCAEVGRLELPWYAEAKRALGASATFLGLIVKPSEKAGGGIWLASAVGDSCLLHIRKGQLLQAFPVSRSQDFGDRPALLNSLPLAGGPQQQGPEQRRGRWGPGDRFLLLTDALAQWLLRRHEAGRRPWQAVGRLLEAPSPDRAFVSWVERLRDGGGLRNDDVTLVAIDL
jgi:hypothetical protein